MQALFGRAKATISEHIRNVFKEGELQEELVVRKFRTTTQHGAIKGKTQDNWTNFYNLDVIISVGYRVKSQRGTQFRIWGTKTLREYIIKGFVLDDNRLKQGKATFGKDYFNELLERVRPSERRVYHLSNSFRLVVTLYLALSDFIMIYYSKIIQNLNLIILQ